MLLPDRAHQHALCAVLHARQTEGHVDHDEHLGLQDLSALVLRDEAGEALRLRGASGTLRLGL